MEIDRSQLEGLLKNDNARIYKAFVGLFGAAIMAGQVVLVIWVLGELLGDPETAGEGGLVVDISAFGCFASTAWVNIRDATGRSQRVNASRVQIGDQVEDCDGTFSEAFFTHEYGATPVIRIKAYTNEREAVTSPKTIDLTSTHLFVAPDKSLISAGVIDTATYIPGGGLEAVSVTVDRDAEFGERLVPVTLIHTRSGSLVVNGFCVSSWEHFTDYWTSLHHRILPHFVRSHPLFRFYFFLESAVLDKTVHILWPHPQPFDDEISTSILRKQTDSDLEPRVEELIKPKNDKEVIVALLSRGKESIEKFPTPQNRKQHFTHNPQNCTE